MEKNSMDSNGNENNSYLCTGLYSLGRMLSLLDKVYKMTDKAAANADLLWVQFLRNKAL